MKRRHRVVRLRFEENGLMTGSMLFGLLSLYTRFAILDMPTLDGGRLLFVLIEAARGGKRISSNKEGLIHMVGFATLIGLVILMSYFDLVRILTGGQILQ